MSDMVQAVCPLEERLNTHKADPAVIDSRLNGQVQ